MKGLHPSPAAGVIPATTLRGTVSAGGEVSVSVPRTEAASTPEQRENFRVISEVLEELYFSFFLAPGDFSLYGGAVPVSTAGNLADAANLPNAAVSFGLVNLPIRARFQRLAYQVDIDYTSPVGGLATFIIQTALWLTKPGGNLTTDPVLTAVGTAAGPTNAFGTLRLTYTSGTGTLVSSLYRHMRFRLLRDGVADVNNNDLHVLGVYLRLFEV